MLQISEQQSGFMPSTLLPGMLSREILRESYANAAGHRTNGPRPRCPSATRSNRSGFEGLPAKVSIGERQALGLQGAKHAHRDLTIGVLHASDQFGPQAVEVPTANQIRAYWWCSPPRIGRQRIRPTVSAARDIGASLCNDKWVRVPL